MTTEMRESTPELRTGVVPRTVPGEPGLWIIILAELVVFGVYFGCITYYRLEYPDTFRESKGSLNLAVGTAYTALLLTGSLFVVLGVHAAQRKAAPYTARWFRYAAWTGIAFFAAKCLEYGTKIADGTVPTTNIFFMLYFVLTMLHLCHVVAATVFLLVIGYGPDSVRMRLNFIEGSGCYWHFVDAVWMFLFALFYLA
ncbi:cytochrome c oxidase subunit 3 [Nocardia wallacei]|uniref:cytochrome c oxidase subunit 3 n=1 Tax=Nocardia wallacei TaxID=480035 RepID=UPI002458C745|nr:cytochrome c oxidase subunit 3 [Nocardia wallacei]